MKAKDLEAALAIRRKLEDAKHRHAQVSGWEFGSGPYFIEIDRASVMLKLTGTMKPVKDALLDGIQEEIDVLTQEITQLGVEL